MVNIKLNNKLPAPWIIGHRGYPAKYPENTLASFQGAIDAGASMIELDVMLSADRKPVVIHDETLERTTNGHGAVAQRALAELKQLDAGSWYHPRFAGQRLPELGEVLDLVNRRIYINIEIKSSAYESQHPADAIEAQVVELLRQKQLVDNAMISSFNAAVLEQVASMQDAPIIAFISDKAADGHTVAMCSRLNTFSWHPDQAVVTRGQVREMHAAGIKVFPYSVNTLADCEKMVNMEVDGVITDDPELAGTWARAKKAA